ncbi:transposase [Desulfovibrio litoralis]|uniref:Putative transposase n=1 Tax=Desulfovibrio litoralis DSM 11393 TaxID=1121455 RepID=A0A1M7TH38_9BACT|nr:putative transposase [Desulfovibrio litoralis DSM 11393]
MKKAKFSEFQIVKILKQAEAWRTVVDVCREYDVSNAVFYRWKSKYSGDIKRIKEHNRSNYKNLSIKAYFSWAIELTP